MTATTFTSTSNNATIAHRPAVDILVERLARNLLAWSDRRAQKSQLTHDRVARILELERSARLGGSSLG